MSGRISLTLEASEMFFFIHMSFSLVRATAVGAILETISDLVLLWFILIVIIRQLTVSL